MDLLFSFMLIIIFLPLMFIISVILIFTIGYPIIYSQKRIGKEKRFFNIYKFRTMHPKSELKKSDSDRLTFVGSILRKTSLDELPQLFNILKLEMSFIGPRPMLYDYLDYFTDEEMIRFSVKPGMTGYAEVLGRHELTWDEQFEIDIRYVKGISLFLDFSIFFKTFPKVLNSKKVKAVGRKDNIRFDEYRKQTKINGNF